MTEQGQIEVGISRKEAGYLVGQPGRRLLRQAEKESRSKGEGEVALLDGVALYCRGDKKGKIAFSLRGGAQQIARMLEAIQKGARCFIAMPNAD